MASVDAFYQRGQVYSAMGEQQKAISDYSDAIALKRDAPYIYMARSTAKKALGDEGGFAEDQALASSLLRTRDEP
jgi:tetratricopeptide (TPR) repeat protein